MRTRLLLFILPVFFLACRHEQAFDADRQLLYCHQQLERALDALRDSTYNYDFTMMPRNILEGDTIWNLRKAKPEEWCSGFWAGILWMDYAYKAKSEKCEEDGALEELKRAAEGYTEALIPVVKAPVYDHDLGFITINSLMKGYEATGNERYREVALRAADSLATLFNPTVGTILSWPRHVKDYGGHNTIMDNMMNLELLFWASLTPNPSPNGEGEIVNCKSVNSKWYDIAVRHAETTMKYHFREDGSCYHVAVYDTLDGHFIKGVTHQGYADSSMWSRGQSWAIYGYTMVYRYTHDQRFLDFAQKVTDIYLKRLKETSDDWVPYWDMDDPEILEMKSEKVNFGSSERHESLLSNGRVATKVSEANFGSSERHESLLSNGRVATKVSEAKSEKYKDEEDNGEIVNCKSVNCKLKDASAACVVASALLELCQYVGREEAAIYREAAINMLRDLSTDRYQSRNRNVAFLMHSTGHHPAGSEIDASIIYADYYYLEALSRYNQLSLNPNL